MRYLLLFVILFFTSCSGIHVQKKEPLSLSSLFMGKIIKKDNITLKANESKSERVAVGLVSAGPIGAIAASNTEENFSRPTAFLYSIKTENNIKKVISHSVEEVGVCVEIISVDKSDIKILKKVSGGYCKD